MPRLRSRFLLALGLAAVAVKAPPASAQAGPADCAPPSDPTVRAQVTRAFDAAQEHLERRRAEPAVALLRSVLEVNQSPNAWLLLARGLQLQGRAAEAFDAFERARSTAEFCVGRDLNRARYQGAAASAAQEQRALAPRVAVYRLRAPSLPGLRVALVQAGAAPRGLALEGRVALAPGSHTLLVSAEGYREATLAVLANAGTESTLAVAPGERLPAPTVTEVPSLRPAGSLAGPPAASRSAPLRGAGGALLALGVVAGATAAGLLASSHAQYLSLAEQCRATCPSGEVFASGVDAGGRTQAAGQGLVVVAAATLLTGVALLSASAVVSRRRVAWGPGVVGVRW